MVKVKISDWKADTSMDEAYKALRTNIQFCGADKKVIAFTSCTPNEGKSNVTFHLAASLAESGKSVLLIDADLRKSVLMGRVHVEEEVMGLTHYLSKQAKLSDVICATNLPKFHIIFSGVVPPNPAELLGSRLFKDMIRLVTTSRMMFFTSITVWSLSPSFTPHPHPQPPLHDSTSNT